MKRHTEGKNTKQEEGSKKKLRMVAIFTERRRRVETGRGKDVRTKINEKMKKQGSKRRENILRQSEGRRVKDKNSLCYTLKKYT